MATGTQEKPAWFDGQEIEDKSLAEALDAWNKKDKSRKALAAQTKPLKEEVSKLLTDMELPDGSYRCQGFAITVKQTEEREVFFTVPTKRSIRFREGGEK